MNTVITLYGYKLEECPQHLLEDYVSEHNRLRTSMTTLDFNELLCGVYARSELYKRMRQKKKSSVDK